ncbi:MAG: hypothetical protein IT423_12415 [Pirellulaceae bacterium]|nr:hypothetical protein [Pirellulaceae bacterium]
MKLIKFCLAGILLLLGSTSARSQDASSVSKAATPARLILVLGAAGTDEYRQQFQQDADAWSSLAKTRDWQLVAISESQTASDQANRDQAKGDQAKEDQAKEDQASPDKTHHDQLKGAIETAIAEQCSQLWLVLIGHGTSERGVHKFNLVGPDVSSRELTDWLKPLQRPLVFIDCSSASSPFLPEISGPKRVIITATRSGTENNYSRFGSQLASSLLDPTTDIDHDDEISLLEAFLSASTKTEKIYRELSRLATEHALLDDNGDKLGTGAEFFRGVRAVKSVQGGKQADGSTAARIILSTLPDGPQLSESAIARRAEIEAQIDALRATRPTPPTPEYWSQLEELLLSLAKVYAQPQATEGL